MTLESDLLIVPTPEATEIAGELRLSMFRMLRRLRTEHPPGAASFAQIGVLMRIRRHGPTTLSALAAADGITPQSMARTVGDLVDNGMLAREPDPNDGRQIILSLTDRAERILHDFRSQQDGWLAVAMLARLSSEEREILRVAARLLDRLSAE
ncbi:MAG: MarR family transcriptional regulator [Thermomicrobiales bacterium]|nr:MarR family transcriptional regulator [Thermomicrobiales bacterium]